MDYTTENVYIIVIDIEKSFFFYFIWNKDLFNILKCLVSIIFKI